jgi:hypothetical protein
VDETDVRTNKIHQSEHCTDQQWHKEGVRGSVMDLRFPAMRSDPEHQNTRGWGGNKYNRRAIFRDRQASERRTMEECSG